MDKGILKETMEFVNETKRMSKDSTFKELFMFYAYGIARIMFVLGAFGGVIWIIKHI